LIYGCEPFLVHRCTIAGYSQRSDTGVLRMERTSKIRLIADRKFPCKNDQRSNEEN
jgi:hypothetical protein